MALKLFPRVLDFGLNVFDTETDQMLICSSEPTTYSLATANALGSYSVSPGALFGSPADYTNGRKITSLPIYGGSVNTGGTPTCWAAVDSANGRLHATGPISAFGSVSSGQSWTLGAFTIDLPWSSLILPWYLAASTIDLSFSTDRYYEATPDAAHLLLHMDGANGSTSFIDATGRHTIASNAPAISTAQSKFGGSSGAFGGGRLTLDGSSDFAFGTGDYTIDFWMRPNNIVSWMSLFDTTSSGGSNGIHIETNNIGGIGVYVNNTGGSAKINSTTLGVANTQMHVAVTRSGTSTRLFINGTQEGGTYTGSESIAAAANRPQIGARGTDDLEPYSGYLDELRVVKGTAIWTSNFTPPTTPYRVPLSGPYNHLSISRASTGYAQTVAGTLTSFATNTLRITDKGLLVEDARTNLALNSQDLTLANLVNNNVGTVNIDNTAAPDGTTTAEKFTITGAGTACNLRSNSTISLTSATAYTISLYVKPSSGSTWFEVFLSDFTANTFGAWFNMTGAGTVGGSDQQGDGTVSAKSIQALANGWYRCIVTGQFTTGRGTYTGFYAPVSGDGSTNGSAGDSMWAWGYQLEAGSFASSYIPTTTTSATRAADLVTCTGNLNSVLTAPTESVVADFIATGVTWLSGTNPTIIGSGSANGETVLGVDGASAGVAAWTGSTAHYLISGIGNSQTLLTGTKGGHAEDGTGRSVVSGGGTVVSDAFTTAWAAAAQISAQTVNGKFYAYFRRISAWTRRIADATLQSYTNPATTLAFPIDADTKVDLNFAGSQYYSQPLVTDYLSCSRASTGYGQTVAGVLTSFATNTLRITDKGLLVEDARTNLAPQSQDFSNVSYWITAAATGSVPTLTADQIAAPDGTTTADKLTNHSAASTYPAMQSFTAISLGAGTVYTLTVYEKLGAGTGPYTVIGLSDFVANAANAAFNLSTGAAITVPGAGSGDGTIDAVSIEALANGWFRLQMSFHFTAAHNFKLTLYGAQTSSSTGACATNDFLYMWGAQLEQASFASSYIPTTTTSATRAADAITYQGNLLATLSALPMSLVADLKYVQDYSQYFAVIGGGASQYDGITGPVNNATNIYVCTNSNIGPQMVATLGHSVVWAKDVSLKVGTAQNSSGSSLVGAGGTVITDTNIVLFNSSGRIGYTVHEGSNVFAEFRRLTVWNTKIADATLQGFTYP